MRHSFSESCFFFKQESPPKTSMTCQLTRTEPQREGGCIHHPSPCPLPPRPLAPAPSFFLIAWLRGGGGALGEVRYPREIPVDWGRGEPEVLQGKSHGLDPPKSSDRYRRRVACVAFPKSHQKKKRSASRHQKSCQPGKGSWLAPSCP